LVTPTASVEAVQETVALVCVMLVDPRLVGTVGAVVSPPDAAVVTTIEDDHADVLPALSRERTRQVYPVEGARPVTVTEVAVVVV
jgi:hypothetical protein